MQRLSPKNKLCIAAESGDVASIREIIRSRVDPNGADDDKDGYTPLIHASKNGRLDAVKSLLENGALVNEQSPKVKILNFCEKNTNPFLSSMVAPPSPCHHILAKFL